MYTKKQKKKEKEKQKALNALSTFPLFFLALKLWPWGLPSSCHRTPTTAQPSVVTLKRPFSSSLGDEVAGLREESEEREKMGKFL
ncbi:hypothetical protein E1A91_A07G036800v1 [Gossypium mustelinum]|uniref:Uncharacterized protein n=1 Tax=Gossypium mustelinum TaxID=34275 RepID=A0A5D2YFP3_GOSMU|nr:hypothetical protein E1A91_A07G036800v1 [Gossypium mustelinum]